MQWHFLYICGNGKFMNGLCVCVCAYIAQITHQPHYTNQSQRCIWPLLLRRLQLQFTSKSHSPTSKSKSTKPITLYAIPAFVASAKLLNIHQNWNKFCDTNLYWSMYDRYHFSIEHIQKCNVQTKPNFCEKYLIKTNWNNQISVDTLETMQLAHNYTKQVLVLIFLFSLCQWSK